MKLQRRPISLHDKIIAVVSGKEIGGEVVSLHDDFLLIQPENGGIKRPVLRANIVLVAPQEQERCECARCFRDVSDEDLVVAKDGTVLCFGCYFGE